MARRSRSNRRRSGSAIQGMLSLGLLLVLFVAGVYAYQYYQAHYGPKPATACDESLWAHVYHPERLKDPDPAVHHKCLTVTGTVTNLRSEDDGDLHIRVHLDGNQTSLLNAKNTSDQHGDLVVEPVCTKAVSQTDALDACRNFSNKVQIPKVGDHVTVVGVYVLDNEHGWMELHPVTSITIG